MAKKDMAPKAKPKKKPLPQKERFIQAAHEAEADETGTTFNATLKKIVPVRRPGGDSF